MKNQVKPEPIFLSDYEPFPYSFEKVDLHFELGEEQTLVRSVMKIQRAPGVTADQPLVLLGEQLVLKTVHLNHQRLNANQYTVSDTELVIAQVPDHFELEILVTLKPELNTALSGLYRSGPLFCTQCEAQGFRRITYFPDRPDVMARFTTTIVADQDRFPVLLSNGNPIQKGKMSGNKHFVTWDDPFKKPCYLFALVAGKLACVKDTFVTAGKKKVSLEIYVEPGNESKCQHALDSLKKAMVWDEQTYGLQYDLDIYMIVAVQDFNMGAMENKGLNIFNAKYVLADEASATDFDFQQVESVIGHEYFHNWTGNRVTCRDWFQLSLKEGLTVFREQQFSASQGGATVKRIQDVNAVRTRQFPEDRGPMAHPVRPASYIEINNFYTMTVYYKGAEVIRMIHTVLGEKGFRKGMDLYFKRHDGQAVTTDDFVAAMADANHVNFGQFKRWYTQAGIPEIKAQGKYDRTHKRYELTLYQNTKATLDNSPKEPFYIPIQCTLLTEEGIALKPVTKDAFSLSGTQATLVLSKESQVFVFTDVSSVPVPSFLADFSAPVNLSYPYRDQELAMIMAHDPSLFNRWNAAQTLYRDLIVRGMTDEGGGFEDLALALQKVLDFPDQEPALVAQLLALPSLEYLGENLKEIPLLLLIQAREYCAAQLATQLFNPLMACYERAVHEDDHTLSGASIQWRCLKNATLGLLAATKSEAVLDLCVNQFNNAHNMTDTMGSLSALNDYTDTRREDCFEAFFKKWQQDPLVVNKWFGLQAMQNTEHALAHVRKLYQHPAFDPHNPNKVYALLGGFSKNPRFHNSQGEGYVFLAQKVIELDAKNPQVASRMVEPLTLFQRLAEPERTNMKKALELIAAAPLSPDVFERVSKSLAPLEGAG